MSKRQAQEASPTPDSAAPAAPEPQDAPENLEELRAEAAQSKEHWDRLLRTTAEFENFRKRAAREKEEAIRYANQTLLERLLPVMDSFDMAVAAAQSTNAESAQSLKDGINLVLQQFRDALRLAGLEEIEAHGKPFDPNLHEAVSQLETAEVEDGHVAQQLRKGYLLRDRLVRPATVVVARKPSA
jgi:molecular chaperone GrpE